MEQIIAHALGAAPGQLAAEDKRLLLSRLLARLSHEIRNPLSSLDVHVQLLHEDLRSLPPETFAPLDGRLEIIRGELHRLDQIVQRFLNLAHPSVAQRQPVELTSLLTEVCDLLRPEAALRHIELVISVDDHVPTLEADPVQLTQALVNLVINAIQAVKSDGRIDLRAQVDESARLVVLTVGDSGPGIPAEKRSSIFEPFFTTKPDGSGLGLWIVQQVAAAHGGAVGVTDAPTGGAIFTLRLPLTHEQPAHG